MANHILEEFESNIDDLTLIPSGGGAFEIIVGNELVYSKKETGEHTDYQALAPAIRAIFS